MLVLSRKKGEAILIGDNIEICILEVINDTIKIGITAPKEIGVLRKELYVSVEAMNKDAGESDITANDLLGQFINFKKNK